MNNINNDKIISIAKKLDSFEFNSEKEEELALEYVVRLKESIKYYIDFMVPISQKEKYYHKYYNTIDYAIKRVLLAIYPEESFNLSPVDDADLEEMIVRITIDLQNKLTEKDKNNLVLSLK